MANLPATANQSALATQMPPLRPAERVAVILSLLDPPQARDIADRIDDAALPRVISAYKQMRTVPKPLLLEVIANFVTELRSKSPRVYGGSKRAAELAEAILEDVADSEQLVTDDADSESSGDGPSGIVDIWAHLQEMDADSLARMMTKERPSVIAAILTRLPESTGGPVMGTLPEELAVAVTAQMVKAAPVSPMTMEAITESLRLRTMSDDTGAGEADEFDPLPRLTAILNRCPVSRQRAVLKPLREDDPDQADAVEERLIRFETLSSMLPRNAAPIIFREVDDVTLNTALRFGSENAASSVDYLYSNISQRLAEQIRQRVGESAMPSNEDGERAQAELIAQVLSWVEEGRFTLSETTE